MPSASDHGLDQTPSSEKKHEAGDSTQSVPLKTVSGTIEWRGPIEYLAGFSSPANLGVTCFLNVVLVAMYQRFRNNPNAWIPTSVVGQEIRKILRTMGMPQCDVDDMRKHLQWLLLELNLPYNLQHSFDETWLSIMEHFSDCPMTTTSMTRKCVVCGTQSAID